MNQKRQVKSKPAANHNQKPLAIYQTGFIVLCGILIILIGVIEWQSRQYGNYVIQRDKIIASITGETSVTPKQVARLDKGFVTEPELITFIETIEQARSYFDEFEISFISDVPEGKKIPKYLPLEFTLTGSYENIFMFLDSLLKAPYVIRVKNIQLVSSDGFRDVSTMTLNVNLYVSEKFNNE